MLKNPANEFIKSFIGMHTGYNSNSLSVTEVMRAKPATVQKTKRMLECISLMNSKGIDSLIVTDEDGVLEGVITAESLRKFGKPGETIENVAVKDVVTVTVSDSAKDAFDTLADSKAEYLVVVNDANKVKGIVTRTGMVKFMAQALWGGDEQ
jgi:osmoprotectant transport system ATP-binding protein